MDAGTQPLLQGPCPLLSQEAGSPCASVPGALVKPPLSPLHSDLRTHAQLCGFCSSQTPARAWGGLPPPGPPHQAGRQVASSPCATAAWMGAGPPGRCWPRQAPWAGGHLSLEGGERPPARTLGLGWVGSPRPCGSLSSSLWRTEDRVGRAAESRPALPLLLSRLASILEGSRLP